MPAYRITVVTGSGARMQLPCVAANHLQAEAALDRLYPDRRYASVMAQRPAANQAGGFARPITRS